jgi:hypothetical protein
MSEENVERARGPMSIRISVAATDPDVETLERCRKFMEELKTQADFPTIGGRSAAKSPSGSTPTLRGDKTW